MTQNLTQLMQRSAQLQISVQNALREINQEETEEPFIDPQPTRIYPIMQALTPWNDIDHTSLGIRTFCIPCRATCVHKPHKHLESIVVCLGCGTKRYNP